MSLLGHGSYQKHRSLILCVWNLTTAMDTQEDQRGWSRACEQSRVLDGGTLLDTTQDLIFKDMAATGGCPGLLVTAQETYCYHGSVCGSVMSNC